ncbi:MAG: c-type cytochrome [Gemmata sp.]
MYGTDPNVFMNGALSAILSGAAVLLAVTALASWLGARGRAMSYLYMLTALLVTFGAAVAVLGFRGRASADRPWHFFLDMKYQAKYTSQAGSKFFADGRSSRRPPAGTVPFDGADYAADAGTHTGPNPDFLRADERFYFGIADASAKRADGTFTGPKWENNKLTGEGHFVNRLPGRAVERAGGWEPLLNRGRAQFDRHCAVCHGTSGRGGGGDLAYGIVGAYGLSVPPANVLTPEVQAQPDGQLFSTIVTGKGAMPGSGHRVSDALDRWAVVAYIRELQFAYGNPLVGKK